MAVHLTLDSGRTRAFCERWGIAELAVFGSAVREDFRPESDLDVLVTPVAGVVWSLMDLGSMREELTQISGRTVDLLVRRAVQASPNWVRRKAILDSAEVVFAA